MFGSKNKFFYQDVKTLSKLRYKLITLLKIKGRKRSEIKDYLKAYTYFIINPSKFDGATIVKDLVDVRNGKYYLDADAMLHDYEYIVGANRNYIKKWKSDYKYVFVNMERNGKGVRVTRFLILTILGSFYPLYKLFTKK